MSSARVDPVQPPYPTELQAFFDRMMPSGVPPLTLFTTLARVPRVWDRFRAGGVQRRADIRSDRADWLLPHRFVLRERAKTSAGIVWRTISRLSLIIIGSLSFGTTRRDRHSQETGSLHYAFVVAPSDADWTIAAYFAKTPAL